MFHLSFEKQWCDEVFWKNPNAYGKHYFMLIWQSLMVAKAKEELEQEILDKEEEKHRYLAERAPPLNMSGLSLGQLQVCSLQIPPNLSFFFPSFAATA